MTKKSQKLALVLLALLLVACAIVIVCWQSRAGVVNRLRGNGYFSIRRTAASINFNEIDINNIPVSIRGIHINDYDEVRGIATNTSESYYFLGGSPRVYKFVDGEWFALSFTRRGVERVAGEGALISPQGDTSILFAEYSRKFYDVYGSGAFLFMYELMQGDAATRSVLAGGESTWIYMVVVIEPDSLSIWQNTYRLYE